MDQGQHGGAKAPFAHVAAFAVGLMVGWRLLASRGGTARGLAEPTRPSRPATRENRGRTALSPAGIPPRGWWDVITRVYHEMTNDRIMAVAAGVTFYTMLALFPGIAAFISLYGLLADTAAITEHLRMLETLLPAGAVDIIRGQLEAITAEGRGSLGVTFFIGLGVALWSASAGVRALMDALNVVYEEQEKRSFIIVYGLALLFTIGAVVLGMVTIGGVVAVPILLRYIGLGSTAEAILAWLRWPILYGFFVIAIGSIYRYGPSRDQAKWRWVIWGAALAGLLWLAASGLFSWYVANFGSYNETYGSLGAVIAFMTWIWLSMVVILVCAELNAEMEHQTARDTTRGPAQPLGQRNAYMADRVAPASD
ncbi:YihY/virulence factor BrkB family protein [Rhodoligotrophos defluvii]|uniref:YihY/virulence factor BrkB family protein n=1 Tax=Rhodoligotrophos defluvii TaxID=2561934 RepID=UPI0010C98EA6|nr:YihY/virulence factor BrkB family protein [Rhodoligotrophos defluvii]